ncbi:MAG: fibrillarin-like rRNA/tRNA 2'-O-methyltransferase, partial [Promethearchaeota archaeon]
MPKRLRKHPKFDGVFISDTKYRQKIFTKNLDKGKAIYGEILHTENEVEYREWNPYRSKLAAAIVKKVRN